MDGINNLDAATLLAEVGETVASKPWYRSKTVWGGIIAIGASLAHGFGVDIGAADQSQLADLAVALAGTAGGVFAIYGRVKAKGDIGGN